MQTDGQSTWVIGRHSDCDIVLGDDTVSRYHAELVLGRNGRPFLVDRRSTHGTWIAERGNWQRMERGGYVEEQAKVKFGRYETTVRDLMDKIRRR